MIRIRSWPVMSMALLLVAAFVAQAEAQRYGGRSRGSLLGLLGVEHVQKELKLSDEAVAKVEKLREKIRGEMTEQYSAAREIEDREKRSAKYADLRDQYDQKAREGLGDLLAREQMIRLYQIRLRVRGAVYGVNHPWIANRLKFTDEQKKKAAELETTTRKKISEAFSGLCDLSQEERRKKYAEVREKVGKIRSAAEEQALGLLTAEQKEEYQELKGEKFEL